MRELPVVGFTVDFFIAEHILEQSVGISAPDRAEDYSWSWYLCLQYLGAPLATAWHWFLLWNELPI